MLSRVILVLLLTALNARAAFNYYDGQDIINQEPAPLAVSDSYTEPTTGATMTRLTDKSNLTPDLPPRSLIVYSRFSPVNTTNQYAIIHGSSSTDAWILRLSDNTILHKINPGSNVSAAGDEIGEAHEIRWDYTGDYPNRIYFVYGTKFFQMDVIDGNDTSTELYDVADEYPAAVKILNDVEGDSSSDSRYWAWQVLGAYNGSFYPRLAFIVYDKTLGELVGSLDIGDVTPTQNASNWTARLPTPNMVEISPDTQQVMLNFGRSYTGSPTQDFAGTVFDGAWLFNLDFSNPIKVGITETHSGWAYDTAGKLLFVHHMNRTQSIGGTTYEDTLQACYADGTGGTYPNNCFNILPLKDWDYMGQHLTRMPPTKPGWILQSTYRTLPVADQRNTVYATASRILNNHKIYRASVGGTTGETSPTWPDSPTYGDSVTDGTVTWLYRGPEWVYNQALMIEIKPMEQNPRVIRVSPLYNQASDDYRDEAPAAISLDGNTVYWTANWNSDHIVGGSWDNSANIVGEVYKINLPTDWDDVLNGTQPPAPHIRYRLGGSLAKPIDGIGE